MCLDKDKKRHDEDAFNEVLQELIQNSSDVLDIAKDAKEFILESVNDRIKDIVLTKLVEPFALTYGLELALDLTNLKFAYWDDRKDEKYIKEDEEPVSSVLRLESTLYQYYYVNQ